MFPCQAVIWTGIFSQDKGIVLFIHFTHNTMRCQQCCQLLQTICHGGTPHALRKLSPKAREMALVIDAGKSAERDTPDYLEVQEGKGSKLLRTPKLADVPYAVQMHPHLIVEFYSR